MDAAAASGDWRSQLQPEARIRVVNKIMDTLKRQFPVAGPDNLDELRKIAVRFEEKTFTAAVNQTDYLKRISMKMLTMESRTNNQMPSNPANQNPPDPVGSHVLQSQLRSTGPIPLPNQPQARQPVLAQGLQNNIASASVQGSATLASAVTPMNGLSQSNMSSISANSSGQGMQQSIYANSQRQIQGRPQQQSIIYQKPTQQASNPNLYTQQLQQHQNLKAKLSHSSLLQSQAQQQQQQQQQQQPLLSATQMQSSQRPLMQVSSNMQSSQSTLQQTQPSVIQSVLHSEHQQNQANLLQQFSSPMHQQHPQAVLRQQQPSQTSAVHQQASSLQQQSAPLSQQPALPQQQHQSLGHQSNITNIQQNQLLGQQNNIPDGQQQQYSLSGQQSSLISTQTQQQMNMSLHQQVASQGSLSGLQQLESQQQSHPFGSQTMSNMQQYQQAMHIMQPQKNIAQPQMQQQQQSQQAAKALMQSHGDQPQPNPSQQQLMSQIQNQTLQLQQKLPTQQQPNPLQNEMQPMQQRLHMSGGLRPPQNAIEPQKQPHQSQRGLPEASPNLMDSTSQVGQVVADWQEEVYRKIQSMKELYNAELAELHQKISLKCQQHDALMPPGQHSEQLDNVRKMKVFLDRLLLLFQVTKNSIQPGIKERVPLLEKQMMNFIASNRRKMALQRQGQQFPHPTGDTQSMPQPQPSQMPLVHQHDKHGNQVPPLDAQGSVTSMQSTPGSGMQNTSMPLSTHVSSQNVQNNIMSSLQSSSNIDPSQDGAQTSLQQGAVASLHQGGVGSLHQTSMSASLQTNTDNLMQHNSAVTSSISNLQPISNVLQSQHMKQEYQQYQQHQQLIHTQQIKQQIQQQKPQILQQQQQIQQTFHQQQKQQQSAQLQAHQMAQLHQMNEMNDLKVRQGSATKPGLLQSHFPAGQRQSYAHQQLKPGASFPISSPQGLQALSPQISQQPSPQVDQGLLSSLSKAVTPLQSTNSPYVPSPSTPLAPSPLPGDHDKQVSGISSLSNTVNMGHQPTVAANQAPSLAVGTPGISASPLLAEYTSSDATQGNARAALPGKSNVTERPVDRLVKAVQSLSPKVLTSSVNDIGSVVSMIDRIAGSAPGRGSRAAVGEDLAAMTKCRLQARNFMSQDGSGATKKMKRHSSAMPLNNLLSAGCVEENFKLPSHDLTELESGAAPSQSKRLKVEANYSLLEEITEINQQLIDTVVGISDEDADSIAAAAEGSEGTVVKCSYSAVAVSPNLKSQLNSALVSPISPLRLLIPVNYPNCSPVLLDKIPDESSKESEDLSAKAKSRFRISLRGLPQPMSLGEMARAWDLCARKVIEEYTLQYGGGSFSSRHGGWENCVTV